MNFLSYFNIQSLLANIGAIFITIKSLTIWCSVIYGTLALTRIAIKFISACPPGVNARSVEIIGKSNR